MIDERFSAYLDGEATPEETEAVWSDFNRDPALREAWGRQHWLRSLLRDADSSAAYDRDFALRVDRALDTNARESEKVVPMTPRRRWRTAASLAAAASVIGAVMLVAEPLGGDGEPAVTVAAGAETGVADEPAAPGTDGRTAVTVADSSQAPDHWTVSDPDVADQLNGYLLEHNGLARGYGMSGATPSLLRVATYGQGSNR